MIRNLRLFASFLREQTRRCASFCASTTHSRTFFIVAVAVNGNSLPLMAAGVPSGLGAGSEALKVRPSALFLLVPGSFVIWSFDTKKLRWISTCHQVFTHFTFTLRLPPTSKSLVTGNEGVCLVSSCFPEGKWVVVARFWGSHRCGGVDHLWFVTRRVRWGHLSCQSVDQLSVLHLQLLGRKKQSRRRRPARTSFPGPGVKRYVPPLWTITTSNSADLKLHVVFQNFRVHIWDKGQMSRTKLV